MIYKVKKRANTVDDWIAGAVDYESEGECYTAVFTGFDAERCAREYVAWKNSVPVNAIPAQAICFFRDGDQWCAVHGDFVSLQESNAGFGATFDEAMRDLDQHPDRPGQRHDG
jgi:hypothetical protein